jgi:hypothetical protein
VGKVNSSDSKKGRKSASVLYLRWASRNRSVDEAGSVPVMEIEWYLCGNSEEGGESGRIRVPSKCRRGFEREDVT